MDSSPRTVNRRRWLSGIGTVVGGVTLAGCFDTGGDHGATDVLAYNATAEPLTVSVDVTREGADDPRTSKTLEIGAHSTVDPVNDSKLPTNSSYRIDVAVENGPSERFEWEDPELDAAPLYVFLDGSENIHFLLKVG